MIRGLAYYVLFIFIRSFIKGFGNLLDEYNRQIFFVPRFSYDFIYFSVLQLPTLSDFCEWILFFTISDAGLDWQVQTHEFYEKLVSYQRSKEQVASLKT